MSEARAPAGWYDDPENPGRQRWWDGDAWAPASPPPGTGEADAASTVSNNGFAVASLVLGILWLWWLGSVLAVIFGHVARSQLSKPGNVQAGQGLATAGLVLGYLGLASLVAILAVAAASGS